MQDQQTVGARRFFFEHDGLNLSFLDTGAPHANADSVLLLHGFPDDAMMWPAQIQALYAGGFRVIAPDMRGYGQSDMAARTSDYRGDRILADHLALLDHVGIKRVHVVGHDWGAAFAWWLAAYHPERVDRLVALSVGHPTTYARAGWAQKRKGWYIFLFLLRGLSERLLLGASRLQLQQVFGSHPDIDGMMVRMRQPGRLTAALRVYRANLHRVLVSAAPDVSAPALGVVSADDAFLSVEQMRDSGTRARGEWRCEVVDGGHWIPLEQPDVLNRLLLDFLPSTH